MGLRLFKVLKRGSKWVVTTEDESRVLGTHDTEAEAEAQLRAIESSKHAHSQLFSVNAWRFALSVDAGKWDRITSFGTKIKDGVESVFDESNLGRMVENFGSRKNDLSMCYDHQSAFVQENGQPAPALAYYNALALVVDGKLVKFATHDQAVSPPDAAGMESGIYGYRCEVTPLGEQLLPNYKYLSPLFTDQGMDEQGNALGYDLIDVAATNTPFQDGVGLTFHRFGTAEPPVKNKEKCMDGKLMERYGLKQGYTDDDLEAAMRKFADENDAKVAEKIKELEEAQKKDEAEEMQKFDVDPSNKEQNAAIHLKTGNVHDEGGRHSKFSDDAEIMAEDDEKATAMSKMARALGITGATTPAKMYSALVAKTVPLTKLAEVEAANAKLAERVHRLMDKSINEAAVAFVDGAVRDGRTMADKRDHLVAEFAKAEQAKEGSGAAALEPQLFAKGTFTVLRRFSDGKGGLIGKKDEAPVMSDDAASVEAAMVDKAHAIAARDKVSFSVAMSKIATEAPELHAAYRALKR